MEIDKQGFDQVRWCSCVLRNGQGDVVKLIDGTGTSVVQYTYDTWGAQTSCTGTLATTLGQNQPFRYRGYVYDTETGWYYLQSRYYDPSIGRFISSDVLLSTGQGVLGHNAYAYCLNNPVRYKDSQGLEAEPATPEDEGNMQEFMEAYKEATGQEYTIEEADTYRVEICHQVSYDATVPKVCSVGLSTGVTILGFAVLFPLTYLVASISITAGIADCAQSPSSGDNFTSYTIIYEEEYTYLDIHPNGYNADGCKGIHRLITTTVYYGEKGDNNRMYYMSSNKVAVCKK